METVFSPSEIQILDSVLWAKSVTDFARVTPKYTLILGILGVILK